MKGITEVLRSLDRGNFQNDAENELARIVEELTERGKGKASLTLNITFDFRDDVVFANGTVNAKVPPVNRKDALFYIDGGTLTRDNPQQEMNIREVQTDIEDQPQKQGETA